MAASNTSDLPAWRRWLTLTVVCVAQVTVTMSYLTVAVAVPTLFVELEASPSELRWISDGYLLTLIPWLLVAGAAADRWGHRRIMSAGLIWFAAAAAAAGTQTDPGALIVARTLMGFGAAAVFPSTLALISGSFPGHSATKAVGVWAASVGAGIAAAPAVAGFLLTNHSWSAIFWVNVPVCVTAAVGLWWVSEPTRRTRHRFDTTGAVLSAAGFTGLVAAVVTGPIYGWTSTAVVASAGAGVVTFAGFIWWEFRCVCPLVNMRNFRDGRVTGGVAAIGAVTLMLFTFASLIVQHLQFVVGLTPVATGVHLAPFGAAVIAGTWAASAGVRRAGMRAVATTGVLAAAAGAFWSLRLDAGSTYQEIVVALVLLGAGTGAASAPAATAVMSAAAQGASGSAAAVAVAAREAAAAVGLVAGGSVATSVYATEIAARFASTPMPAEGVDLAGLSVAAGVEVAGFTDMVLGREGGDLVRAIVFESFAAGFRTSMAAAGVIGLCAAVVVWVRSPDRSTSATHV